MKVLIIGGNLFFGKQLAAKLLAQGHQVTLLNRGNHDDGFGDRVQRIHCDRDQPLEMARAIGNRRWDVLYDQVCFNARQAEQACEVFQDRTRRYILTSTQAVYGMGKAIGEESFDPQGYQFNDVAQDYAGGKRQAEAYLYANAPWPVTAVRLPIVMGENDISARLAAHIACMRSGNEVFFPKLEARLSLIHAPDAADCLELLLDANVDAPINCAPVKPISLAEFKSTLERVLQLPMKLATAPSKDNFSPYGIPADWYMAVDRLAALGHEVPAIEDWLADVIRATDRKMQPRAKAP